jgi:hypothetical protein
VSQRALEHRIVAGGCRLPVDCLRAVAPCAPTVSMNCYRHRYSIFQHVDRAVRGGRRQHGLAARFKGRRKLVLIDSRQLGRASPLQSGRRRMAASASVPTNDLEQLCLGALTGIGHSEEDAATLAQVRPRSNPWPDAWPLFAAPAGRPSLLFLRVTGASCSACQVQVVSA